MIKPIDGVLRIILGSALSFGLPGCAGYVQGDGGAVVVAEPDVFLWGGYDGGYRGDYGRRGAESRGYAGRTGGPAAPAAPRPAPVSAVPSAGRPGGGGRR